MDSPLVFTDAQGTAAGATPTVAVSTYIDGIEVKPVHKASLGKAAACYKCRGSGTQFSKLRKGQRRLSLGNTTESSNYQCPANNAVIAPNSKRTYVIPCKSCKGLGHTLPPARTAAPKPAVRPFKPPPGWIPRGPPSRHTPSSPGFAPQEGEMLTSLSGHWMIYQLVSGHRYTTDEVCTAALAIQYMKRHALPVRNYVDIGTGLASVLNMVSWNLYEDIVTAVGIEAQSVHVELARKTIDFNGNDRAEIRHGDLRDIVDDVAKRKALVPEGPVFDLVTGTPPYFPASAGALPTEIGRGMCSFELRGGIEVYCAAAAQLLALTDQSRFVVCQTALEIERTEKAARTANLIVLERWDIYGKEGHPKPLFCVFMMARLMGTNAREKLVVRKLNVRDSTGEYSREHLVLMDIVGKAVIVSE
ncbi:hypothetical protein BC832DRAFT_556323 [Gaertneriomyces semiglobifer]|nr:hypothetical protein BC832DRAFT_556323 [Gaertneriomyces semiglobifer]